MGLRDEPLFQREWQYYMRRKWQWLGWGLAILAIQVAFGALVMSQLAHAYPSSSLWVRLPVLLWTAAGPKTWTAAACAAYSIAREHRSLQATSLALIPQAPGIWLKAKLVPLTAVLFIMFAEGDLLTLGYYMSLSITKVPTAGAWFGFFIHFLFALMRSAMLAFVVPVIVYAFLTRVAASTHWGFSAIAGGTAFAVLYLGIRLPYSWAEARLLYEYMPKLAGTPFSPLFSGPIYVLLVVSVLPLYRYLEPRFTTLFETQ